MTKQVHLAAHFPGVNNTTVWSDPAAGSHIEFSSFTRFAQTAERGLFDFLFLAEGLRLREQNGKIYDDWLGTHFDDGTQEFAGTAAGLADLIEERAGAVQGVRLHPAAIGHDLRRIADDLAPELRRRGLLVDSEAKTSGAHTLRETLGLRHPVNRYSRATVSGGVR